VDVVLGVEQDGVLDEVLVLLPTEDVDGAALGWRGRDFPLLHPLPGVVELDVDGLDEEVELRELGLGERVERLGESAELELGSSHVVELEAGLEESPRLGGESRATTAEGEDLVRPHAIGHVLAWLHQALHEVRGFVPAFFDVLLPEVTLVHVSLSLEDAVGEVVEHGVDLPEEVDEFGLEEEGSEDDDGDDADGKTHDLLLSVPA
jgi:hypothetical protein